MSSSPSTADLPEPRPSAAGSEGAVFDFDDLQALREEYEERIARLERDRDAAVDVLRRDADNRLAALREAHAQQLQTDAHLRQELIEDLTVELAAAREEGERRAAEAERRRAAAEAQLAQVRHDVARVEAEVARIRQALDAALAPPDAPAVSTDVQLSSFAQPQARPSTPPPVPAEKRRRIRLR